MHISIPKTIVKYIDGKAINTYSIIEEIGHGGFSKVFKAVCDETKLLYAIKVTSLDEFSKDNIQSLYNKEISILSNLNHPNIIKLFDSFSDNYNNYILQEYCDGHSLKHLIEKRGKIHESEVSKIINQVVEALIYLHENRIIHRDIKLDNILLSSNGVVKLIDFGLSAQLTYDDERRHTFCGTPLYLSPEVICTSLNGHSYEVDIWAIGITSFILLTGHAPYEPSTTSDIYNLAKTSNIKFPSDIKLTFLAKDFVKSLLQFKPDNRPCAEELKLHPFINSQSYSPHSHKRVSVCHSPVFPENPISKFEENTDPNKNSNKISCFITRYCDCSEKFGVGYKLSNGSIGVCFNDSSRMLMNESCSQIYYWAGYQDMNPVLLSLDETKDSKRVGIIKKLSQILSKSPAKEQKTCYSLTKLSHVKYIFKSPNGDIMFRLDDRNVQVNFVDGKKLVVLYSEKKLALTLSKSVPETLIDIKDMSHSSEEYKRYQKAKAILVEYTNN